MKVSASELARELGVSRQLVYVWRRSASSGFPSPVGEQARNTGALTPVWDLEEVKAWRKEKLTASRE